MDMAAHSTVGLGGKDFILLDFFISDDTNRGGCLCGDLELGLD